MEHQQLADGRWQEFTFFEQMANIGSETERTIKWKNKGNVAYAQMAFERALELLELTIADPKNRKRLKELSRLKEVLIDYFAFDNIYNFSDRQCHNYFYSFNFAANIRR